MLNRIRRAVSRTRVRYFPKGRHRRPLTLAQPTVVHLGLSHGPTLLMGQRRDREDVLAGEETALVRPYVLASEENARRHSTTPHERFPHTCFVSAGAL
jgi:hypothetical protein